MNKDDEAGPIVVFSGTIWEAGLVKSMLEDAGIMTFLQDENTGTMAPWYTAGGGAGSVKVIVSVTDAELAGAVVAEFWKNSQPGEGQHSI